MILIYTDWLSYPIGIFIFTKESKEAHTYYYDNFQLDQDYEFEECLMYLRDFKEPFPKMPF